MSQSLFNTFGQPTKPRIFVSYHHAQDQNWYELFTKTFGDAYSVFTDSSLERKVDSDDADYTRRAIRERNITGSSLTIVLCGPETWKRRWIDWEIQMTLNKQHALLGIALTTCARNVTGRFIVPDRLADNIQTGFAEWATWPVSVADLGKSVQAARERSRFVGRINNSRPSMQRSRS